MNFLGTEEGTFDIEEPQQTSIYPARKEEPFSIATHYVANQENFRESENENPVTMDSISSFLETMHSKNLTLKKLAKVQQRRIDELTQENMALRQASEVKDEEIRQTKAHLDMLLDVPYHTSHSQGGSKVKVNTTTSKVSASSPREPSNGSKESATPSKVSRSSKKTSTGDRRKISIIVSHKVAVKRVMHLMRKINGACNRRSVGLYTFVCCFAQASLPQLPQLLGFSSDPCPIVYVPYA